MNLPMDACFLIGLYDERDQYYEKSRALFEEYFGEGRINVAILLWPAMYESVSTRFVRDPRRAQRMEREWPILKSIGRLIFLDDGPYRADALQDCFAEAGRPRQSYRGLSLTDRVLRSVLSDPNVDAGGILTFNQADFSDVCKKTGKLLIS